MLELPIILAMLSIEILSEIEGHRTHDGLDDRINHRFYPRLHLSPVFVPNGIPAWQREYEIMHISGIIQYYESARLSDVME